MLGLIRRTKQSFRGDGLKTADPRWVPSLSVWRVVGCHGRWDSTICALDLQLEFPVATLSSQATPIVTANGLYARVDDVNLVESQGKYHGDISWG